MASLESGQNGSVRRIFWYCRGRARWMLSPCRHRKCRRQGWTPDILQRTRSTLTGNCPIREHTGDGAYVGRCDFACYDDVCPRHGRLSDYPTNDDREVDPRDRDFVAKTGTEPS